MSLNDTSNFFNKKSRDNFIPEFNGLLSIACELTTWTRTLALFLRLYSIAVNKMCFINLTLHHRVECKENDASFNHSLRFLLIWTRPTMHWNGTPMPMKPMELKLILTFPPLMVRIKNVLELGIYLDHPLLNQWKYHLSILEWVATLLYH